jgi:hypothetical protein
MVMLSGGAWAQTNMSDLLKAMPDSLTPYLSANNRLDLIDFKAAGMKAEVSNALDGKTTLTTLTDRYALMALSEASKMEMLLLDKAASQVLCVVSTYGMDIQESVVRFYTTDWQPLETRDYVMLPEGVFTVTLNDQKAELTIRQDFPFDRLAIEGQKETDKVIINLKWKDGIFK